MPGVVGKVTIITSLKMISDQLEDVLGLMRENKKVGDERYEEQKEKSNQLEKMFTDRQDKFKKDFEEASHRNMEDFVAGLKGGLKEGGITDLAEEAKRRAREEAEWRKKVLGREDEGTSST